MTKVVNTSKVKEILVHNDWYEIQEGTLEYIILELRNKSNESYTSNGFSFRVSGEDKRIFISEESLFGVSYKE